MRSEFRHASYLSSPGGNTTRRRRLVSDQTRRRCTRCQSLSGSDQFLRLATLCQWSRTGSCNCERDDPQQSSAGMVFLEPVDRPRRRRGSLCRCASRGSFFRIRPVESVVVDGAQDEAFGKCAQEEIFVRCDMAPCGIV